MRPQPPEELLSAADDRFVVAGELREWMFDTFIVEGGELTNPDHAHLADAEIGVLWTNAANAKNVRVIIGQAELMPPMAMGKWQRARALQQIEEWFGCMPDFLITISAPAASEMDDASFCALIEHELYHCAQKLDLFGMPKFKEDGSPSFCMRGHDVEEFVGVVARYGVIDPSVAAMVEAAKRRPSVALADIRVACGTCLRAVA